MQSLKLTGNNSGYTLIEIMLVMAILTIVLGAIYTVFTSVNRSCTNNEVSAEVMQHMRTGIEFMEQDIRMAGLDRFGSADAGFEWVLSSYPTQTGLRFTADRNDDGVINDTDFERITYRYDAGNQRLEQCLYEGTAAEDWDTVAENVTNFQFSYFDEDDLPIATPVSNADTPRIRTVQVSMTIQQPAGRLEPVNRTLTKRILCRNTGF
jgi:prepilin-type N-terminal cleavage/methylation domain-containing protein